MSLNHQPCWRSLLLVLLFGQISSWCSATSSSTAGQPVDTSAATGAGTPVTTQQQASVSTAVLKALNGSSYDLKYRRCYMPPTHLIPDTSLSFSLQPSNVTVISSLRVAPNPQWHNWLAKYGVARKGCSNNPYSYLSSTVSDEAALQVLATLTPPLVLDGVGLTLLDIKLNGQELSPEAYSVSQNNLIILQPPNQTFKLQITNVITLSSEPGVEGLAVSDSGSYISHCESEGFRMMTYFLDRPDVLSKFTVRIEAESEKFPVLLSNGELRAAGQLAEGLHYAIYEDPIPKPSYLFALVAGPLVMTERRHVSSAGKTTTLRIYTPAEYAGQVDYALSSLQQVMAWDEAMFERQYDLDVFNVVGTEVFSPGAMENPGLVIFKLSRLVTHPNTHTDAEALDTRNTMAHEYLHQWSGNRVTIRDWLDLGLKEGLTSLREDLFSADIGTAAAAATALDSSSHQGINTLEDRTLQLLRRNTPESAAAAVSASSWQRVLQAQDLESSPASLNSAVLPASYTNTGTLYTWTPYDKGAEYFRLYHTLLGPQGFAQGLREYFTTYDGQAAVFEQFHASMSSANPTVNLTALPPWLSNTVPPSLNINSSYNSSSGTVTLEVEMAGWQGSQETPLVPLKVGILDAEGIDIPFKLNSNITALSTQNSTHADMIAQPLLMLPETTAVIDMTHYQSLNFNKTDSCGTSTASTTLNNVSASKSHSIVLLVSQPKQQYQFQLVDTAATAASANSAQAAAAAAATPAVSYGAVSLLRDWSAPVLLHGDDDDNVQAAAFLARYDSNPYSRWHAVQRIATRLLAVLYHHYTNSTTSDLGALDATLSAAVASNSEAQLPSQQSTAGEQGSTSNSSGNNVNAVSDADVLLDWLREALQAVLLDTSLDGQFKALLLQLPSVASLQDDLSAASPVRVYQVRLWLIKQLASRLRAQLEAAVQQADTQLATIYALATADGQDHGTHPNAQHATAVLANATTAVAEAAAALSNATSAVQAAAAALTTAATSVMQSYPGRRRVLHAAFVSRKMMAVATAAYATDAAAAATTTVAAGLESNNATATAAPAADAVFAAAAISTRAVRNAALSMLAALGDSNIHADIERRYYTAVCLTDRLAAIHALEGTPTYYMVVSHFYNSYGQYPHALLKWFKVQASSEQPGNTVNVMKLMSHPAFNTSDADQCTALLVGFTDSMVNFHADDGSGYKFVADAVLQVDPANTSCAKKLATSLTAWDVTDLAQQQQEQVCRQLVRLNDVAANLSAETAAAVKQGASDCQQ